MKRTIKMILQELSIYSFKYGAGEIPMSENPPIIMERKALQEIEILIDKSKPKDIRAKFEDDKGGTRFAQGYNFGTGIYHKKLRSVIK